MAGIETEITHATLRMIASCEQEFAELLAEKDRPEFLNMQTRAMQALMRPVFLWLAAEEEYGHKPNDIFCAASVALSNCIDNLSRSIAGHDCDAAPMMMLVSIADYLKREDGRIAGKVHVETAEVGHA